MRGIGVAHQLRRFGRQAQVEPGQRACRADAGAQVAHGIDHGVRDEPARVRLVAVAEDRPVPAEAFDEKVVARRLVIELEEAPGAEDVGVRSIAERGEQRALQAGGAGAADIERLRHGAEGGDQPGRVGGGKAHGVARAIRVEA